MSVCAASLYFHFLFVFYFFRFFFIDGTAEDMTGNGMRKRGERHVAKGAQAVTQTRGRRREDKPSAHGTPALPTELNSAPCLLPFKDTFVSIEEEVKAIHLQKCDEGP